MKTVLEETGYFVDTAENGNEAIRKTRANVYSLAIIDIRLPDMQGTQLLTRLKDTTPRMRRIITTGYPALQNAIDALNRGADAYMMKPFDMDKVLETIEIQLKKQEEEREYSQERVTDFIHTRVRELEKAKTARA